VKGQGKEKKNMIWLQHLDESKNQKYGAVIFFFADFLELIAQ
jgi:hypothetical protein